MQPPTTLKQLCSFLGLVTYYCDMWPCCSHILSCLTDLLKYPTNAPFTWNSDCQSAFLQMKSLVTFDALLAFPDHNKPFHIETNASNFQLGAVIKQDNCPIAYYTCKLNSAQKNYTTIEKELLSFIKTFKEFHSKLLGSQIQVHTDYCTLTHKISCFSTQCVMCWHLLLKEHSPTFHYIKGPDNIVADALSHVPTTSSAFLSHLPSSALPHPSKLPSAFPDSVGYFDHVIPLVECLLAMPASSGPSCGHDNHVAQT